MRIFLKSITPPQTHLTTKIPDFINIYRSFIASASRHLKWCPIKKIKPYGWPRIQYLEPVWRVFFKDLFLSFFIFQTNSVMWITSWLVFDTGQINRLNDFATSKHEVDSCHDGIISVSLIETLVSLGVKNFPGGPVKRSWSSWAWMKKQHKK